MQDINTTTSRSLLGSALTLLYPGQCCTRALYSLKGQRTITGRSLELHAGFPLVSEVHAREKKRCSSLPDCHDMRWESTFGSLVIRTGTDKITDGMNEAGLVVNALYAEQGAYTCSDDREPSHWPTALAQYLLDTCSTVKQAIKALRTAPLRRFTRADNALEHDRIALSDSSGDSVVIELNNGKWHAFHGKNCQILTPSPVFSEHLKLAEYLGKLQNALGNSGFKTPEQSALQAAFGYRMLANNLPAEAAALISTAAVFSVIASTSAPMPPQADSTLPTRKRWHGVADQTTRSFYVENTSNNALIHIPFAGIDFTRESSTPLP